MSKRDQQKVIALQKTIKILRAGLEQVCNGARNPEGVASNALDEAFKMESQVRPTPLVSIMEKRL